MTPMQVDLEKGVALTSHGPSLVICSTSVKCPSVEVVIVNDPFLGCGETFFIASLLTRGSRYFAMATGLTFFRSMAFPSLVAVRMAVGE